MLEFLLKNLPVELKGQKVIRQNACTCCGHSEGMLISEIDYWDIAETKIVKCANCGTAQLDPMLTDEQTAKGCLAYYIEESLRTSPEQEAKNHLRNFRRGIHFANGLKRKKQELKSVLELGPGSGYFLQGIQFVYPDIEIAVLDVNQEILDFNSKEHGYKGYLSTPEKFYPELENKFDLVIARDIIEHVTHVNAVFENVYRYLKKRGLFHFITPNGHEDVWRFYIRYMEKKRSELLINHVNYFDGKGLLEHLKRLQFSPVTYYTYQLKTTFRGRGRKLKEKLKAPISQKRNADFYINEKLKELKPLHFSKSEILNKWYLQSKRKFWAKLICAYKHANRIKVDPTINVGHEIFGLFRK